MSREAMLARIRSSLGHPRPGDGARVAAILKRLAPSAEQRSAMDAPTGDYRVAAFSRNLEEHSAAVIAAPSAEAVPALIAQHLSAIASGPVRVRLSAQSFLTALPWGSAPGLMRLSGPPSAADSIAISHALAGIADTGTLVLASAPDHPLQLALMPETHVVTVCERDIVARMEDAFDTLRRSHGPGVLPRAVCMVTGPSRTGDIGGNIVLGAHGPHRLVVVVVGGD